MERNNEVARISAAFIPFDAKHQFRRRVGEKGVKNQISFKGQMDIENLGKHTTILPHSLETLENDEIKIYINQHIENFLTLVTNNNIMRLEKSLSIEDIYQELSLLGQVDLEVLENLVKYLGRTNYATFPDVVFLSEEVKQAPFPDTFSVNGCPYICIGNNGADKNEQRIYAYVRAIDLFIAARKSSEINFNVWVERMESSVPGEAPWLIWRKQVGDIKVSICGVHLTSNNTKITDLSKAREVANKLIESMFIQNIDVLIGDLNINPDLLKNEYMETFCGQAGSVSGGGFDEKGVMFPGFTNTQYSNSSADKFYMGGCILHRVDLPTKIEAKKNYSNEIGITGSVEVFKDDVLYPMTDHPPVAIIFEKTIKSPQLMIME